MQQFKIRENAANMHAQSSTHSQFRNGTKNGHHIQVPSKSPRTNQLQKNNAINLPATLHNCQWNSQLNWPNPTTKYVSPNSKYK